METKLVENGNSIVEVTVAIEKEPWKANQEKALRKLAEKVELKGFRKGKVPFEMAKDHVSPVDAMNEAINLSLNDLYKTALVENKLQPYGDPAVNVTKVSNEELEVVFTITLMPTVELGQYKDLNIEEPAIKVSTEEVDASLKVVLDENSELVIKEGPAALGDTVVMDFVGYTDGKEFDGGSAKNYELVLGSNQFIPGFEDQLVGATAESVVKVNVKFPEQYVKELAGKDALFVCTIHEIKEKKLPELNDEFVASLGLENVKTVDDLRNQERAKLVSQKHHDAHEQVFLTVLDKVIEGSKFNIADSVLANEAEAVKKEMTQQIEQNGITLEQYKEITGQTDETLAEQFKTQGLRRLQEFLVLFKVGEVEKIGLTQKEVDDYYQNVANQYGMELAQVKEILGKNEDRIRQNLVQGKIEQFILNSNLKHKEAPKAEAKEEKKAEKKEEKPAAAKKAPAKKATTTKKTTTKKEESK